MLDGVPEIPAPLTLPPGRRTYRQISYRESGAVGYLEFAFPGGAMSTDQCRRLLAAYRHAQTRPVKVIVLGGPRDFFANGIHLNVIQAADDPGAESWRNINAIDDLVQVNSDQHRPAHRGGPSRERRGGGLIWRWPRTRSGAGRARSSTRTTG